MPHELPVVFIRGHHIGFKTLCGGTGSESSYDVIGLIALNLDDRDAIGFENPFYIGYRGRDVLGLFVSLGLVVLELVGAKCLTAGRVETYSYMRRILLAQKIVQSVAETEDCRCVESPVREAGRTYECVVCAIDQRVGVK